MKVDFKSRKLKSSIIKINEKVKNASATYANYKVYGVTKEEGISITGNVTSADLSEYIVVPENTFAFNPYRINIGSIGLSGTNFKGLVSPAYVVFKTKNDLLPEFLFAYLKSDTGIKLINWYGNRGGVRNALRFDDLGEIDIPDLTISQQKEALNKIGNVKSKLRLLSTELELQENYLNHLRQTILQEAVQGKLVPQDANDEPAEQLLQRMKAEKARLVKEGKLKKEKELPLISEEEIPFELPKGWVWCRLGDIITMMDAGWSPACKEHPAEPNKWGVLKTTSVQPMIYLENENKELPESLTPKKQYEVNSGDILITRAGPFNRVGICCLVNDTRNKLMISDKIIRFHLLENFINSEFITLSLNTGVSKTHIESKKSGMALSQVNISQDNLKLTPTPIPPFSEQRLIVYKVEQIMQAIANLEHQVQKSKEQSQELLQTILREAFTGEQKEYAENEMLTMAAEE